MKNKIFRATWASVLLWGYTGCVTADTADAFGSVADPRQQYQIAMQILGDQGSDSDTFELGQRWLRLAAAHQHAEAQYTLALYHHLGIDDTEVDYLKAVRIYEQAARQGHLVAQFQLSNILLNKELPVYDPQRALYWLSAAAEQNDTISQYSLATLYRDMYPHTPENTAKYYEWLIYAAENGYRKAQYVLGSAYIEGKELPVNTDKALYWFRLAALQGDASSQYNLALLYDQRGSDPENQQQAIHWFAKSSAQDMPDAQFNLGRKYLLGQGVDTDIEKGLELITLSAEADNPAAQTMLAHQYFNGQFLDQDFAKAMQLYEAAAQHQYAEAQYRLALMFARGQGVKKSEQQAVYWIRKAAELDHPYAQYGLGAYLINGVGIEKDMFWAAYWISRAAAQGQQHAIEAEPSVLENLTESEQKDLRNMLGDSK